MKLMAWFDRQTPRDLYDLAGLAEGGYIDRAATDLVKTVAGFTPSPATFGARLPPAVAAAWLVELSHQMSLIRSADECHEIVRLALTQLDTEG